MITWEHGKLGEYLPPDAPPVKAYGPDLPCLHMVDDIDGLFIVIPYEDKIYEVFGEDRAELMILTEARRMMGQARAQNAREEELVAAGDAASRDAGVEEELFRVFHDDGEREAPQEPED